MAREYKAFISYRHLPADIDTAVRLHRIIERFTIPRALRKNGMKKPGFVFRDQDELPLSSDLSGSIREALDRSEFLIVICSPETPKSLWVLREISYFLENHDRDHVLTVLVDGRPEESFPELLTQVYDESGNVIDHIEPLGANIVAESPGKRHRLLKTESLRIIAALIGCAFDELYRRQQRYRRRLIAAAGAVFAAIVSAFLGMLLVKNAQIEEQLRLSQINESKALAALSKTEYGEGDYARALEYALAALPAEGISRPYVPAAEEALVHSLNPYMEGFKFIQSYEQDTDIKTLEISADGSCFATADSYGNVRLVDTVRGSVIWEVRGKDEYMASYRLSILDEAGMLLVAKYDGTSAYSLRDGAFLWTTDYELLSLAESGDVGFGYKYGDKAGFALFDIGSGETLASGLLERPYMNVHTAQIDHDGSGCAFVAGDYTQSALYYWDVQNDTPEMIEESLKNADASEDSGINHFVLKRLEDGNLLLANLAPYEGTELICYDRENQWAEKYRVSLEADVYGAVILGTHILVDEIKLLEQYGNEVYLCRLNQVFAFDADSGELLWEAALPSALLEAKLFENGGLCLALMDGVVTMCAKGTLGINAGVGFFDTDFDVEGYAIGGETMAEGSFLAIPSNGRNKATAIKGIRADEASIVLDAKEIEMYGGLYEAPSGELSAFFRQNYDTQTIDIILIDSRADYSVSKYNLPLAKEYFYTDEPLLTNDGSLLWGGLLIEPESAKITGLSKDGSFPEKYKTAHIHWENPEGKILSAAVFEDEESGKYSLLCWEDGRIVCEAALPEQIDSLSVWEVKAMYMGGNGTVMVSVRESYDSAPELLVFSAKEQEWRQIAPENFDEESPVAPAQHLNSAAFVEGEYVRVRELYTGEILMQTQESFKAHTAAKMMFVCDDRFLLIFTMTDELVVLDAQTGREISRTDYGELGISFLGYDCRYDCFEPEGQDKLFVIYNNSYYNMSLCICIDLQSMTPCGSYYGIESYVPDRNEVLVNQAMESLHYETLYSLEDMMDMARAVLSRTEHKNGTVK